MTPLVAVVFPALAIAVIFATRYVSLMSILVTPMAAVILAVLVALDLAPWTALAYACFAVAIIEYMHIPNIRRLLAGTEPRIGRGGDRPATG